MSNALDHPLVRDYLAELDQALTVVPAAGAAELREQITAHLDDALPPGADDRQVAAVLDRLGRPGDLAAEAAGGSVAGSQAVAGPAGAAAEARQRVRRRRGWRFWTAAGVAVAVVGAVASYLVAVETAPVLQMAGASGWWYLQDRNAEADTSADGVMQTTVPIRSGQWQGFAVSIENDSDWTQTILGPAVGQNLPDNSPGSLTAELAVSFPNTNIDRGGFVFTGVRFGLPGVIPPHQIRVLRVLWRSTICLQGKGSATGIDELALRVRVGWITRTEAIPLGQGWYLAGPSTGTYASTAPACQ